jgi:hypothetical protein
VLKSEKKNYLAVCRTPQTKAHWQTVNPALKLKALSVGPDMHGLVEQGSRRDDAIGEFC